MSEQVQIGQMSLPDEVLVAIFSFLETPEEISSCLLVCKKWRPSDTNAVWKAHASVRYGPDVAEQTIAVYQNDWTELLRDGNRRGALPTLQFDESFVLTNVATREIGELVVKTIKWYRMANILHVYCSFHGPVDPTCIDIRMTSKRNHDEERTVSVVYEQLSFSRNSSRWLNERTATFRWRTEHEKNGTCNGYFYFPLLEQHRNPYLPLTSPTRTEYFLQSRYTNQIPHFTLLSIPPFTHPSEAEVAFLKDGELKYTIDRSPFVSEDREKE